MRQEEEGLPDKKEVVAEEDEETDEELPVEKHLCGFGG
jgi:hypothetical protein